MPFQKGNQLGKLNKGKSHQAWNKGKKNPTRTYLNLTNNPATDWDPVWSPR